MAIWNSSETKVRVPRLRIRVARNVTRSKRGGAKGTPLLQIAEKARVLIGIRTTIGEGELAKF
jgi:hypothetical protein